jgi:RHS repeat-associated protein
MPKYLNFMVALILALMNAASWAGKPSTNKAPTVSLVAPSAGAIFAAPASITLTATASDSDGTIARVEFYQGATLLGTKTAAPYSMTWTNVAGGTYSLTALAVDNLGVQARSAAVSISVTGAKVLVSSPANGAVVTAGTVAINGTYAGDSSTSVWIDNGNSSRLATLSGNSFSTTIPVFPGPNTLNVSVARTDKTSDSASLSVIGADYPKIAFTSPTTGTFNQPANVIFAVDALSPSGSISKVNFYRGSTLLSSVTAPPYQYTWNNAPVGNYTVTAQAVDNLGYMASASTSIGILGSNTPPSASLSASASGAAPASITLVASAADPDGTIASVEFYQGASLMGSTNIAPYTLVLPGMAAGSYSFTAKATDNSGSSTVSAPANVTVQSAPPAALVAITGPADGASFTAPAAINLSATTVSNAIGVSFYKRSDGFDTLIGESLSTTSPYTFSWNVRSPGSYAIVAKSIAWVQGFNEPFTFESIPVTVTVAANPAGEITYLHHDFAGSAIGATDINGAVIWKEDYKPYGERVQNAPLAAGNRQFFTGKPLDADTGLSYMGARYYDPAMGRFMGIDPVGILEGNLHSFNRYAYANNNPYRYIDPNGMWAEDIALALPGMVVGSQSLVANLRSGNYSGAGVDALGLVADGISLALPGIPGGAGLAIAATRGASSAAKGAAESLSAMKGMGAAEREATLSAAGFGRTKIGNSAAKNETWKHADGSEVRVHPYGNQNASPYKSGNNAHLHKQDAAGRSLNDRGGVSTNPNDTHIGLPNPSDFLSVRGRQNGS